MNPWMYVYAEDHTSLLSLQTCKEVVGHTANGTFQTTLVVLVMGKVGKNPDPTPIRLR